MALGALLLEGDNYEFWVSLGCLSENRALKQHALIRGLQLDISSAVAWAYLGKVLSYIYGYACVICIYCELTKCIIRIWHVGELVLYLT